MINGLEQMRKTVIYPNGKSINRNLCHRDIKLENFFIGNDFLIKLGDFGHASIN